jgi:hypothetical protein
MKRMRKNIIVFGAVVLISIVSLWPVVSSLNAESTQNTSDAIPLNKFLNNGHLPILKEAVNLIENEIYKSVLQEIIDFIEEHGYISDSQIEEILDSYDLQPSNIQILCGISGTSNGGAIPFPGAYRSGLIYFAKRICLLFWDATDDGNLDINIKVGNNQIFTEHSGFAIGYAGIVSNQLHDPMGDPWNSFYLLGNAYLAFVSIGSSGSSSNSQSMSTSTTSTSSTATTTSNTINDDVTTTTSQSSNV